MTADTRAPHPAWQSMRVVQELRIRAQCPYCSRKHAWNLRSLKADPRGSVRVQLTCSCGAYYVGSLAGDWYSPSTLPFGPNASGTRGGRLMPGGAFPIRKGRRAEQELVWLLRRAGVPARRVPLSGAAGGPWSGDVEVHVEGEWQRAQVKARRDGFVRLYRAVLRQGQARIPLSGHTRQAVRWLESARWLFVKADRMPWLVVSPASDGGLNVETLRHWVEWARLSHQAVRGG